jgi:hypothetical protein
VAFRPMVAHGLAVSCGFSAGSPAAPHSLHHRTVFRLPPAQSVAESVKSSMHGEGSEGSVAFRPMVAHGLAYRRAARLPLTRFITGLSGGIRRRSPSQRASRAQCTVKGVRGPWLSVPASRQVWPLPLPDSRKTRHMTPVKMSKSKTDNSLESFQM